MIDLLSADSSTVFFVDLDEQEHTPINAVTANIKAFLNAFIMRKIWFLYYTYKIKENPSNFLLQITVIITVFDVKWYFVLNLPDEKHYLGFR